MKAPAIVEVEWVDSQRVELGWEPRSEYRKAHRASLRHSSTGYVLRSDKRALTLIQSYQHVGGHVTTGITIPRPAIVRQRTLAKGGRG